MARSSSGKSVARAAATGGGTTYRGQMPVNWYAALVIIVILGVGSIALAKYNYNKRRPWSEPAVGTSWHAGLAFDICGTMEPALPASPTTATTGLTTTGSGVLAHRAEDGERGRQQRDPREVRRRVYRVDVDQHQAEVPLVRRCPRTPTARSARPAPRMPARSAWCRRVPGSSRPRPPRTERKRRPGAPRRTKPADLKLLNRQLITVGFVPEGTPDAQAARPRPSSPCSRCWPAARRRSHHDDDRRRHDDEHRRHGDHHDGASAHHDVDAPPATTTTKPSSTTTTK